MTVEAVAAPAERGRTIDFIALAKPRLNLLVVLTACVGFYLGAGSQFDPLVVVATIVGTTLVACGSAALNQVYERDIDALMLRTRMRPLPAGRLQPDEATAFGIGMSIAGLACLTLGANALTGAIALATLVSYLGVYTPLKRRTPASTFVGAVPGALPPMLGWAAARGELGAAAWALFAIVFVWQIPHFFAIAWLCRDDYARAKLPMLTVLDRDGRQTGILSVLFAVLLIPVSVLPTTVGLTGTIYLAVAPLMGIAFAVLAILFARQRTTSNARRLFFGSLIYLPALWILMMANLVPGRWS